MPETGKDSYLLAVVDDQEKDLVYLKKMILSCFSTLAPEAQVHIRTYTSAKAFLFAFEDDNQSFDMIFLDIEMPDINGVEVARRIRAQNETVQLVFVTGYSDYIAEGYDVSALHYLLKPLQRDKLQAVISKAISLIRRNEKRLALHKEGKLWLVPLYEINYIDVYTNYVTVHAVEEVTIKRTLSDVEKELDERFFRVGRSLIVNLNKIRKADRNSITLLNGCVVPIPGNAYEHLMRAIIGRL